MLLSSLEKLSGYTGLSITAGEHSLRNRRRLSSWQAALSAAFERFLWRGIEVMEREEVLEVPSNGMVLHPFATPILQIEEIVQDVSGLFSGNEETLDPASYAISADGESIVFDPATVLYEGKTLKVKYTGGLARHAVRSEYRIEQEGAVAPGPGEYVRNGTSSAAGIVRKLETVEGQKVLTVENLFGIFEVGDELYFAQSEENLFSGNEPVPAHKATITAIESRSIAEAYPDLERAVEIETRYMEKHQLDFENISTMDGQTQRRQPTTFSTPYVFQPETLLLLARYRKVAL